MDGGPGSAAWRAGRWLAPAGVVGVAMIAAVPALGSTPQTELRDAIGPMIILAAGLTAVLAIAAFRSERRYPTKSAPAILLIGLLVGGGPSSAFGPSPTRVTPCPSRWPPWSVR